MPPLTPQPQEESHKTLWVIGIAIAVFLLVGLGIFALVLRDFGTQPPDGTTTPVGDGSNTTQVPVTPGGSAGEQPIATIATVGSQDANSIAVWDFKSSPTTEPDPVNPGLYYLSGGTSPSGVTTPYSILYLDASQSFNITLLQEPLAEVRLAAEQELQEILGVSWADMCRLRYWVGVPDQLNTLYSGKNIGFSYCPGATPL